MTQPPAFQLYAGDFLVDTASWDVTEIGIYCRLLFYEWANGPLPNDIKRLARCAGCDIKLFSSRWERLIKVKFITSEDGLTLFNRRLEETREKQAQYLEMQSKRGKKSAAKRWGNPVTTVITTVTPRLQPEGQPDCNSSSLISNTPIVPTEIVTPTHSQNGKVPYSEIRALWIEILCPPCPIPREQNDTWHKECRARWTTYEKAQDRGLEWCRIFFEKLKDIPFYMGENDRGWTPDIGWVWKAKNFWKIVEKKL